LMPAEQAMLTDRGGTVGSTQERFQQAVQGKDYFLITQFSELETEPELKTLLADHYLVYKEGDGYLIYDLRAKTK
jgi:hypothetical protein